MSLIVCGLTTGVNVYLKSTSGHCVNPLATNLSLYREINPFRILLRQNNYLQSTMLLPRGGDTKDHKPLHINA